MKSLRVVSLLVVFLFGYLVLGCETAPESIPEDLSKAQMFQQAQEEVDLGNYHNALRYYEEFISRNPEDAGGITEAQYEIAFIAYKQEQYDLAESRFTQLLEKYEETPEGTLPEWPQILSRRLLEIIDERRQEELLTINGGDSAGDESNTQPSTQTES